MQRYKQRTTKSSLTPAQTRFIELMQRLNFGRIENIHIVDGEPQSDPPPRVFRDVKLGGVKNGPRPELDIGDFELKAEVINLIDHIQDIGEGVIERLEVQHGLPFRMTFEDLPA